MSTKAQAVLEQIRSLPPADVRVVWGELQRCLQAAAEAPEVNDPTRSARGMFAGSRLTEALLASRAEERARG